MLEGLNYSWNPPFNVSSIDTEAVFQAQTPRYVFFKNYLTLSCIMLLNGQTYFRNHTFFKSVFGHFTTCIKALKQ